MASCAVVARSAKTLCDPHWSTPMLLINNAVVSQLLTMDDCIRVQEEAFRQIPTGGAIHRPRIDMYFPCERADGYFRWGTMEGANDGYFAIRMKSDIITWPRDAGGARIGVKYLSREDSHVVGMLGSGGMARCFLEAFACVRDIRVCKVYSPTPAHREAFAQEMTL